MGIANAISPLGGDFYTLSHNPAGLATYRSSEFSITPSVRNNSVEASLSRQSTYKEVESDFMVSSIGMVVASTNNASKWKTVNFGIGYNRQIGFDRSMYYEGETDGSITDRWMERAQGHELDELLDYESGLAYDAGAIFEDVGDNNYISDYEASGRGKLIKNETITSSGGMGEIVMGFGANLNHKLYLGASLGVPIVNYSTSRYYEEVKEAPNDVLDFRNLKYNENLTQSGAGINAKLGIIYRFNQMVRWSAFFHSPSIIEVLDEFDNSLEYTYNDFDGNRQTGYAVYPPDNNTLNFEYEIITPYQIGTGLAIIAGKNGFVSGELSYTDYSTSRFDFDPDLSSSEDLQYERELNADIDSTYGGAVTARIGGELALDMLRLRAGAIFKQRPYANDDEFDTAFSAGIGLRMERFFLDLGLRKYKESSTYVPYLTSDRDLHPVQEVATTEYITDIFLTLGFRF
jgi:long-subunit fatty acid transport protein